MCGAPLQHQFYLRLHPCPHFPISSDSSENTRKIKLWSEYSCKNNNLVPIGYFGCNRQEFQGTVVKLFIITNNLTQQPNFAVNLQICTILKDYQGMKDSSNSVLLHVQLYAWIYQSIKQNLSSLLN